MNQATKNGTTIPGTEPAHSDQIDGAKGTMLIPDRPEGSENIQRSGLEPDGEDDDSADPDAPRT